MSSSVSFQFTFRIRAFAIIQHAYSYYRSRSPGSSFPADPSKFLSLSSSRVRLVFLTFVSRLTYECPVVTARPIPSAAARELHERTVQRKWVLCTWMSQVKIHLVYADLLRANANAKREHTNKQAARRAYVIIVAAHVASRIFRPRIPFSIPGESYDWTAVLYTRSAKISIFISKKKFRFIP